jgi:nicotinate-nucleotide adenylyltransferase
MSKIVGVLGGTFDPIHHGHLRLALECATALDCAETLLIPAYQPPLRPPPVATPAQRLHMVELALRGAGELRADAVEIQRAGTSWTVDTLAELRRGAGTDPMCLIVGSDAFRNLDKWRDWQRLLEYAHIVVASRPNATADAAAPQVRELEQRHGATGPAELRARPAGRILRVPIPALDISSTRVRGMIAASRSVRYLVPDAVIEFIHQQALYRA